MVVRQTVPLRKTFSELNAPFPIFEASIQDASEFIGEGVCGLCGRNAMARFELGIGSAVMVTCHSCQTETGLDAEERIDGRCRVCAADLLFPDVPEELACCYDCLRRGRAALTKDTELGMVSWEQALEGLTHGVPGLHHTEFEMVQTDSDWVRARVDPDILLELVRTPTYSTIQGDRWLFCCRRPMIFIGEWTRDQFRARAPDGDGKTFLASVLGEDVPGLWEDQLHDTTGIYVFRCGLCGRLRGHWDIA